jgi:hypothetical protein
MILGNVMLSFGVGGFLFRKCHERSINCVVSGTVADINSRKMSEDRWRNELHIEISGSHGGEYEDDCLVGCCAVYSGRNRLTFRKCCHHNKGDASFGRFLPDYTAQHPANSCIQFSSKTFLEENHSWIQTEVRVYEFSNLLCDAQPTSVTRESSSV